MKKFFPYIMIILSAVCSAVSGCDLRDELPVFSDFNRPFESYSIDYLWLEDRHGEISVKIYDHDDMEPLFDLANKVVLKKSHEGDNLPDDFDYLCSVVFVNTNEPGPTITYRFDLSKTGDICDVHKRLAAVGVVYVGGRSTEILDEVNRLLEVYG